jgi:hypothetical protein
VLQVIEDLFDHHWVFDAGDNLDSAAACIFWRSRSPSLVEGDHLRS